jgi:hypothetical protein
VANVVLPIVRLFFPCEEATLDLNDEKWLLKNPLHTVEMPPGVQANFVVDGIALYAQFTGGVGSFNLSVQLVDDSSGVVLGVSRPPISFHMPGGSDIFEEVFEMPPLRFPHPGVYQIRLIANHASLENGAAWLRVLSGTST